MQHKWLRAAKILASSLLLLTCAFTPAQSKPAEKLILKQKSTSVSSAFAEGGGDTQKRRLTLVRPVSPEEEPKPQPAKKKLTLKKADTPAKLPYTQQEIDMIAAVVMHEVGHCSKESKLAVTRVIINRLVDGRFGSTVYEVLHAKGQFGAIHNYYDRELVPDEACFAAVREALSEGGDKNGALYFCNPQMIGTGSARWFSSLQFLFSLDGQNYYR